MITINNVQVDFANKPNPLITFLQGADMDVTKIRNNLRTIEETYEGVMQEPFRICTASGNEDFSADGTVKNAITVKILVPYVVDFEAGSIVYTTGGGNLLATYVDSPGAIVYINNAVGALTVSSTQLEYSSFDGAVTINMLSSYSGTEFPTGTLQQPVNNFTDALTIANFRGLNTMNIIGNALVDNGADFTNFIFRGQNANLSFLDIDPSAIVINCTFEDCMLTGTLDGGSMVQNAVIENLIYVNGIVQQCMLNPGMIILGGGATAHFLDCFSGVPGILTPIIDCGGSGQSLALRNYNGGIKLMNKTGPESVSLDMNSGQIILDSSTVTGGTIVARGVGKLIDEYGNVILTGLWNGGVTILNEMVNMDNIEDAVLDASTSEHQVPGTVGKKISDDLTLTDYIGLSD